MEGRIPGIDDGDGGEVVAGLRAELQGGLEVRDVGELQPAGHTPGRHCGHNLHNYLIWN